MPSFRRSAATAAAVLALTAAGVAAAVPAYATPEDGQGCAGFPTVPATYVCVISLNPGAVTPTTTTTNVPVSVPAFCYVAGCTEPKTVNVPVPGLQPGSGTVAVLWYKGTYYPVAIGTDTATEAVNDTIALASGVVGTVNGTVDDAVAGLPTSTEVVAAVMAVYAQQVQPRLASALDTAGDAVESVPTAGEVVAIVEGEVQPYLDAAAAAIQDVRDLVAELPSPTELRQILVDYVRENLVDRLPPVDEMVDEARENVDDLIVRVIEAADDQILQL